MPNAPVAKLDSFIARWTAGDGGQERANYAPFLSELCDTLEVRRPDPASHDTALNAYVFERAVIFREPDGSTARGRIDLYKRGSFVLEAKQSRKPGKPKELQGSLFVPEPEETTPRGRRTASRAWDVLMLNARQQAEQYAKALPAIEGWPPFLIVCDVGHCFEIYADFTGQGKNYAQFPDRQGFRIYLEELRQEEIRERLRLIWLDPQKLDPAKIAAKATREVAERLAKVSKYLEEIAGKDGKKLYDPETVALFLMRCLFTMFAEDVELLPKDSFREILKRCKDNPSLFPRLVGQLWEAMDKGGFEPVIELRETRGKINCDLTVGVDVTRATALQANAFICSPGVKLHGDGFIVTRAEAEHLGLGRRPGLENHIRHYRNGRDLTGTPRGVMVIDLFDLDAKEVRKRFPEVYQHVLATVKESKDELGRPNGRDVNNRKSYRENWWIFGEPRRELRPALEGLPRYIATPVTQKHRSFEFLSRNVLPDDALMIIASDDAFAVGILSAKIHNVWASHTCASLGPTPRYIKSRVFDPFPFPDPPETLKARIRATAEELDALRKQVQAEYPGLTLTQIYNVLQKLRAGEKTRRARGSDQNQRPRPHPQGASRKARCAGCRGLRLAGKSFGRRNPSQTRGPKRGAGGGGEARARALAAPGISARAGGLRAGTACGRSRRATRSAARHRRREGTETGLPRKRPGAHSGRVRGVDGSEHAPRREVDRRKVPARTKNRTFRRPYSGRLRAHGTIPHRRWRAFHATPWRVTPPNGWGSDESLARRAPPGPLPRPPPCRRVPAGDRASMPRKAPRRRPADRRGEPRHRRSSGSAPSP
jgi:hypothetical protein